MQVRQMREQLMIKKKKMIDELKELRKEYKLQNDGAQSAMGPLDGAGYSTFNIGKNYQSEYS